MSYTGKWNIIVVDWSPLSHSLYIEARLYTNTVALQFAKFCIFLNLYAYLDISTTHIIGHSLGAQIAAYTSFLLKKELGETIGRITGLDPAAPLFEYPDVETLEQRLDPDDAYFVDVIHTNANHLGIISPAGHVDFYPNGGEVQPDCNFCKYFIFSAIRRYRSGSIYLFLYVTYLTKCMFQGCVVICEHVKYGQLHF